MTEGMLNILDAREDRWRKKLFLAEKYCASVVSLTLNIPGPEKTGDIFIRAHGDIAAVFLNLLSEKKVEILYKDKCVTPAGPELLIATPFDAFEMKKLAMSVENNHPLGRLADIDVMNSSGKPVSREDVGYGPRRCLLCEKPARECIVLKRHKREDVMAKVKEMISGYHGCLQ